MSEHKLPSNIKQIGTIEAGLKIYIEDFALNYLNQFAEAGDNCERVAFLVGKIQKISGEDVMFVNGAIQAKFCQYEDGVEIFTDKSFFHAEEQLEKFFSDQDIVGWMQSQPGFGTRLNPVYASFHRNNFRQKNDVMLVIDSTEKLSAFYAWTDDMTELREKSGYFVYYEKNGGMQKYMQQNRLARYKPKLPTTAADDSPRAVVAGRLRADSERAERTERFERPERAESRARTYQQPSSAARSAASRPASGDGRRLTNMLVTLAAVLVIICFIMSAGLIQNEGRISTLETSLNELTTAYNSFQLMVSRQLTESVFAGTSDDADSVAKITPSPSPGPTQAAPSFQPTASPTPSPTPSPEPSESDAAGGTENETGNENEGDPSAELETDDPTSGLESDAPAGTALEIPETYVVEPGDTLSYIAFRFYGDNTMIPAILAENEMADANMLQAGQEIKLPQTRVLE